MLKTVGFPSPFVPFEEMVKYQYNISIDGCVSAWARTPWILLLNQYYYTTASLKHSIHLS